MLVDVNIGDSLKKLRKVFISISVPLEVKRKKG